MTQTEVSKLVAMLIAAFPNAKLNASTATAYEKMLVDLELAVGIAAIERITKSSRFMPTVAEIRSEAALVKHGPVRLGAEAWGDVQEAIRRIGSYAPAPTFTDPLVADCVRMMGWKELCLEGNAVSDRARFIDLYDGLAQRQRIATIAAQGLLPPAPRPRELPWIATSPKIYDMLKTSLLKERE